MAENTSPASNFHSELPGNPIRNRTTAYGIWKYGKGRFSPRDATRWLWSRVKQAAAVIFIALCVYNVFAADTYTTKLQLRKPDVDVEDTTTPWGTKINNNFDIIDANVCNLTNGAPCTFVGPLITTSAITAGRFYGDGSYLTGVQSTIGSVHDDWTSQVNGIKTQFDLTMPASTGSLVVYLDGIAQRYNTDYTTTTLKVIMATAPASDSYSFFANYLSILAAGSPSNAVYTNTPISGDGTTSSPLSLLSSSVTLQGNKINIPNGLVKLDALGAYPPLDGSLITDLNTNLNGIQFSGTGAALDAYTARSDTITLQGNEFNGASQLVKLSGSSQLPSVGGTNLTSLNASNLGSGTVPNARLDSTSATLQGNSFNAANNLVKLDATARLPAVDGSQLTGIAPVIVSSYVTTAQAINIVNFVGVATATVSMAGGKRSFVIVSMQILNSASAARDYTMRITKDSVALSADWIQSMAAGDYHMVSFCFVETTTTAGSHDYGLLIKSNNATGTQQAFTRRIVVEEL